jgi:PKD repeat protein
MSKTFTITVTATNSAGPGVGTTTETINDRVPTASFTFTPASPSAGQTVNFDATASADPDGTIASYAWNFGDGTTGTGVTTSHSYNPTTTTSFTLTLTVTDNSGSIGSTSQSVTVTVSVVVSPPVVTISSIAPNPANTGQMVTVTFTVSSTAAVTGITVNWGDGTTNPLAGTATSDTHTYTTTGTFTVTVTATNSAGPGSATTQETITAVTGNPVLLTFQAFDVDDFENGVGQLQVLVNGHLVVDLPAGLNHLTGSGDYKPYESQWVNFGTFDITSFVVPGENTIVFMNPLTSHQALVRNINITQGDVTLLFEKHTFSISHSRSLTLTFSSPPLGVTSFTVAPTPVVQGVTVTFTATFTGGSAPFTCSFTFGDESPAVVVTTSMHTCSATHSYDDNGDFMARVKITGHASTDVVRVFLHVVVLEDPTLNMLGVTLTPPVISTSPDDSNVQVEQDGQDYQELPDIFL